MINVKNVTKVFNPHSSKALTVLDNASLSLPNTGMVFIVGQSGIGKSTILNAIGGLINYEGEITYDNLKVNIEKYRKENIGVIFQDFLLFDDVSIKDNILVGLENAGINSQKEVDYRVGKLLSAVNLQVNALRKAGDLSLGQKQRVAIARALASSPKILLADEPTGNLDSANAYKIMDILKSLSNNHLIICVTHNQTLVKKYADYAFSINNRKFEELDIKKIDEDPNYVDYKKIYANNLTKKEIKEGNLSFKVYSDSSTTTNEIQIIKRGNEILVVGDNISVAKPSEVTFVSKKEKIEKEEKEDINSNNIDLDFNNVKSKKRFKDFFKHYFLTNKLKQSNTKKKVKAKFIVNNIIKIVYSIIIFVVADILYATVKNIRSSIGNLSSESQVLLSAKKGEDGFQFSLSGKELLKMVNDPDSGIIEDSFYNPTYVYVKNNPLSNEDLVPNLVGGFKGINVRLDNNSSNDFTSISDNFYSFTKSIYFYSYEKAKEDGLCPDLNNYEISDNELLLNKSLASSLTSKDVNEFVNKEISVNLFSDTSYSLAPLTFKIKAIVDTPYNVCFVKNDIANLINFNNMYAKYYRKSPSLKNVTFVDYEDIKNNSDYTISNGKESDEAITNNIDKLEPKAYAIFSKSIYDEIGFNKVAPNLLTSKNSRYYTSMEASITYNPDPNRQIICFKDRSLNYSADEQSVNNAIDQAKTKKKDSRSVFGFNYIKSQIINNSSNIIPNNISLLLNDSEKEEFNNGNYIIVPDKMLSSFNFTPDSFNNLTLTDIFTLSDRDYNNVKVFKTYEGNIDDKIYISRVGFNHLKFTAILKSSLFMRYINHRSYSNNATVYKEFIDKIAPSSFGYNEYEYIETMKVTDSSYNPDGLFELADVELNSAFLSKDIYQTKIFFDEYKYENEKIEGYIIKEVFDSYLNEVGLVNSSSILATLGTFALIYFLFLVTNGFAKANSEKYYYGVLRSIGKTRKEVNLENFYSFLFEFGIFTILPVILITLYISIFNLYFMGFYIFLFLLALFIIDFLCENIPSLIMLRRTPNGIIRSLN